MAAEQGWAWPDYVFRPDYPLLSMDELQLFISEKKHLPGVPTAKVIMDKGLDLAEMNKILLEKIEEQALMILELHERLKSLENKL